MDQARTKPGTLFKRAFFNQYNFILMGGTALFSIATGSWLPAIVGLGTEVLWLVLGADTSAFRRWVDKQDTKEGKERLLRQTAELVANLDDVYVRRFEELRRLADEVQAMAAKNEGLETILIKDEMAKLGQLLHSFLKIASSHQRLSRYLHDNPVTDLERDIARCQRAMKSESDPRVQASLKQALSLGQKRLKQHDQIEGAWKALSVQMDTLEKAFDYLKSHILGIGTREELAAELDGLVTGVASVSELDDSTSEIMQELRTTAAARQANLGKGG